jgi:hypothetical protein
MRKNLLLLFAGIILAAGYVNAQVMYSDDFEAFTAGTGIAQQETTWWNTWSGTPGSAEDPLVSDAFAYSGTKSVRVSGTNDGVIEFADLTTGRYRVEFYLYVPTGRQAYWNIMQNFNSSGTGLKWGMQIFMQNGVMTIDGAGAAAATYNYNHDEWVKVQHFIDLTSDWVDLYVNDELVHAYQWSKGTFNDGTGINKLDAFNFYAWNVGGTAEYYMDNFLIEEVETPYAPTNFAYTLENENDVVLTWDAPTEGTPESYTIARDGVVIGTTTELTLTDLNVYPNTYDYSLLAFYGTSVGYSAPQPLEVVIPGGNDRNFMVFEMFTGTWCGYCPTAAQAIDEMVADGDDVAVIEYHGGDAYETPGTAARSAFYEQWYDEGDPFFGYPTTIFNGQAGMEGAMPSVAEQKEIYEYYYNEYIDVPAVYTLDMTLAEVSLDPFVFNLNISAEETFAYFADEMRLIVVLTETNIAENWGGLTEVNFVCREMLPSDQGTVVFETQTTYSNTFELTVDAAYNVDKCQVVAYIQNWTDGTIVQANKIDLYSFVNSDIESTFATSVYPNPANDILNISADENINKVEILGTTGQVVYTENKSAVSCRLDVNNLAAGVYFVKVYTNSDVTIHKVTIE